jgi:hypothetical protein
MGIGAEVKIQLKDDTLYRCFYHRDGYYDGIGKELWYFLKRLSVDEWEKMEVKLSEQVIWYVNINYYSVHNSMSLIISIG